MKFRDETRPHSGEIKAVSVELWYVADCCVGSAKSVLDVVMCGYVRLYVVMSGYV